MLPNSITFYATKMHFASQNVTLLILHNHCEREKPKKRESLGKIRHGAMGPNYASNQAQSSQDGLIRGTERSNSPKGQILFKRQGQTTKDIRLRAKQGRRDVQAREGGSFLIKYPSPLHLMYYTNLTCCINSRMTPEQCSHSLQPTLPPPTRQ